MSGRGRLAVRSREPELMDGAGLGDAALHARVLADLARINRVTRTHAPVLDFLRRAWSRHPPGQTVAVLDVGCGEGDLLRAVHRAAARDRRPVRLVGLDLHPHSVSAARAATPAALAIDYRCGDVFATDPGAVDYVVSSQLAHHLDDDAIVAFIQWQQRHARAGWCVADLRRHWFAYYGFRWLARVAGWHRVVRIDGTRSIARSCTEAEWRVLLARAGVAATIARRAPFRLTVSALAAVA